MYVDYLDVLISKYTGHLIIYNVLQHVVIFNSKLYSKMIYTNVAKCRSSQWEIQTGYPTPMSHMKTGFIKINPFLYEGKRFFRIRVEIRDEK